MMPSIGYLTSSDPEATASMEGFQQFMQRLEELGFGRLTVHHRFPQGGQDFDDLAAELVGLDVDVIVVGDSRAIPSVRAATDTIPIVMAISGDVVGLNLVNSLTQPDGNLTGLTQGDVYRPLDVTRLKLLLDAVPGAARVAVLRNGAHPGVTRDWEEVVQPTAQQLDVEVVSLTVQSLANIETALGATNWPSIAPIDALYVMPDPLTNVNAQRIVELAAAREVPAMYGTKLFVDAGGLMYFGRSRAAMSRRAAEYVDKILRGVGPQELPIELPATFEFVIELDVAAALDLEIPQAVLDKATELRGGQQGQ
jgi:putative ABC transport system substrate-binding protein